MASWSKLADMELDDDESLDAIMPIHMPERPKYPFGLKICLCEGELKKLGLDLPGVGDVINLRAFAEVTPSAMARAVEGLSYRFSALQSRTKCGRMMTEIGQADC